MHKSLSVPKWYRRFSLFHERFPVGSTTISIFGVIAGTGTLSNSIVELRERVTIFIYWRCDEFYQKLPAITLQALYMAKNEHLQLAALLLIFLWLLHVCTGDIGTAGQYAPPYLPTACYGNDLSKFPSNNLFASAGDGLWDNGAACGRQYFVRCLSAETPGICKPGQIIKVNIVDKASRNGVILVLSTIAFGTIANPSASFVNIEYAEA